MRRCLLHNVYQGAERSVVLQPAEESSHSLRKRGLQLGDVALGFMKQRRSKTSTTFFSRQEERVTVLLTAIRTVGGSQMHQPLSRKRADCCRLFTPTGWSGQSFPGSSFKGHSPDLLVSDWFRQLLQFLLTMLGGIDA